MQKYSFFLDHTLIKTNRPRASVWKWFILGLTLFYYLSQQPQYISRNKKNSHELQRERWITYIPISLLWYFVCSAWNIDIFPFKK